MKKNILYNASIIIAFTLIYALGTGVYFSCMYRSTLYIPDVDSYCEGYFYLLNIIGLLGVAFFMRKKVTRRRMLIAYSVSLLGTSALAFLLFLPLSGSIYTAILFIVFVMIGATQGCYVFLMTEFIAKENRCLGLGIGASLSVLINYLFALIDNGEFVQSVYALIIYGALAIIACVFLTVVFKRFDEGILVQTDSDSSETEPTSNPTQWSTKAFLLAGIFIALSWIIQTLAFFFPYNDSLVLGLSPELLRVTNVLGLLVGGFINTRDKKFGALSSLIILATPMLYILLRTQAGVTVLIYIFSYFFTGILSVYRFGITADMSDSVDSHGNKMTFLCIGGLMFGRLGEGSGALLGISLGDNTLLLVTVTCFVLVVAVAFFILHYIKSFIPVPALVQTHEDRMNTFKAKNGLSSREMNVLELILDGKSNTEIASCLFISENTVKFHVGNILKKTGCKSRKELSSVFYQ